MADLNLDLLFMRKSDFKDFRDISANIKDEKINIFIREAQFLDIRTFLGAELYAEMQDDFDEGLFEFDNQLFNDLWFGVDAFNGYMNAGIYFAYTRFLLQQQVNVSRFGVESVQSDISEDISNPQIRSKTFDSRKVALKYQEATHDFLVANSEDYPLFDNHATQKPRTAFSFFKL